MNDATLKAAMNYAQSGANTWKNDMQYLIDMQNQQKLLDQQTATQKYQNLINQINQQRSPIQQQYDANTQAAYLNKMLAGRQINQNISQMGLNASGFGVGAQLANETAYGQNLNQLNLANAQAMQALDNQITNTTGEYNASLSGLENQYTSRLMDLQKYISEGVQSQYNTLYNRYMDEAARQEAIKQANRAYDLQKSSLNYTGNTDGLFGGDNENTIKVQTQYFNGMMPASTYADLQLGSFDTTDKNGVKYQPSYINGVKISGSVGTVSQYSQANGIKNSSGVNIDNQKLWKLPDGSLWVWNGSKMMYEAFKGGQNNKASTKTQTQQTSTAARQAQLNKLIADTKATEAKLQSQIPKAKATPFNINNLTQQYSSTALPKVTSTYTPKLSSKAATSWLDNLSKQVIKNKGINTTSLIVSLKSAYAAKTINDKDVVAILKSFGLQP